MNRSLVSPEVVQFSTDKALLQSVEKDKEYCLGVRELAASRLEVLDELQHVANDNLSNRELRKLSGYHNRQIAKDASLKLIPRLKKTKQNMEWLSQLARHTIVAVSKAAKKRIQELNE